MTTATAAAPPTPPEPSPQAWHSFAASDTGRTRSANEDFAYAGPLPGAPHWTLLAVADGVGGHDRGAWASQSAIELLARGLGSKLAAEPDPEVALADCLRDVNRAVWTEAVRRFGSAGPATTLVAVVARGNAIWWASAGDSRIYVLAGGQLRQVSTDHSWVAAEVQAGRLSPESARTHKKRNVVTRTIGFEPEVSPDSGGPLPLTARDCVVLCSDGLHGPIDDPTIARTVAELGPELAAVRLVDLANDAGGPDNVTVIVASPAIAPSTVETARVAASTETPRRPPRRRRGRWLITGLLGGLALGAAGAAGAIQFGFLP